MQTNERDGGDKKPVKNIHITPPVLVMGVERRDVITLHSPLPERSQKSKLIFKTLREGSKGIEEGNTQLVGLELDKQGLEELFEVVQRVQKELDGD